jgi:methyl-accepting chemotaxis protein PixJ
LQSPQQVQANRLLLENLTSPNNTEEERPDSWKSFRIITNAQGKSIAQYLRLHKDYPLGTAFEERSKKLEKISLPTNIDLQGLSIVQDALRLKRPFKGIVVLDKATVQKLGLGEQLKGSETDTNIKGLAAIAVEPIEIGGNLVGVAIAGSLINNSHIMVDTFQEYYGSEVSVYQGDARISTTIPARDGKNRAIGERVSTKVKQAVLDGGKELSLQETIGGTPYLTYYVPLYDYRGKQAKPVGMMAVGTDPKTLNHTIAQTRNVGYGIGFGILLLAGAIAIPIAESFSRPIKRLQDLARKIARGEKVAGLTESDRQDEIGVLSQELNRMATQIEVSLDAFRQETAREQLLKEVTLALSQYPQVPNTIEKTLEVLRLDLNVDRAFFYRFNEQTLAGEVVAESVGIGFPRAIGALITDPCFHDRMAEEYRRGRIQSISNIHQSDLAECHIKMLEPFAIKAHLVVPVLRGSRRLLTGLLVVNQCSRSRVWQSSEIDLLVQVATQLGLAFDRAN